MHESTPVSYKHRSISYKIAFSKKGITDNIPFTTFSRSCLKRALMVWCATLLTASAQSSTDFGYFLCATFSQVIHHHSANKALPFMCNCRRCSIFLFVTRNLPVILPPQPYASSAYIGMTSNGMPY